MRKSVFVLPIIIGSFLFCSSESVSRFLAGSSVFVIYDAGDGKYSDGETMIGCRVRLGATWGKLFPSEKPSEEPKSNDYPQLEFNGWYLDGEPIHMDRRIVGDCIVTASYIAKESQGDFDNDSWAVLAREANQGLDHLKTTYATYLSEHGTDTFVGLTKKIKFNGQQYEARVIGEEDDVDVDGNKVALTFELTNAITNVPFATDGSNSYQNSLLRSMLNEEILNLFEVGARDAFKAVAKKTNVGNGTASKPSTKIVTTYDKIFPLSLSEMDGEAYIEKFTIDNDGKDPRYKFYYHQGTKQPSGEWTWEGHIEEEGDAYDYYKVNPTSPVYQNLARKALGGANNLTYWVRSPDVQTPPWAWVIDNQGLIGEYSDDFMEEQQGRVVTDNSVAVVPCFAIGGATV